MATTRARIKSALLGTVLPLALVVPLFLIGSCTAERVVVPPKVAKALDLPVDAEGPHKGQVTATPELARVYAADYAAQLAAAEDKTKAERDAKVQDAKDRAESTAAAAVKQVAKTKKNQSRALQEVLDAQADELDAIAENAAETQLTLIRFQRLAATKADAALATINADREASGRAFAAAIADQQAREEKRLGVLNGVAGLATNAAGSVGGPWGGVALTALGLVGGWLGLSKPGDKQRIGEAEADAESKTKKVENLAGTVQTLVKAIDVAPFDAKRALQAEVAKISTPTDEIHITEAKAALKT